MNSKPKRGEDLAGRKFNRITVIGRSHTTSDYTIFLNCVCDCNPSRVFQVRKKSLLSSNTKSCGCLNQERRLNLAHSKVPNLIGQQFGRLTVESFNSFKNHRGYWNCKCSCSSDSMTIVNSARLISGGTKSCGCYQREVAKAHCGEIHGSWKHEITREQREEEVKFGKRNRLPRYRQWRESVYKRDNHTCQISGQKGGLIQVHHLYNWADFEDLRFDITNGITLSKSIHKLFHKEYGRVSNTPSQFLEFKQRYQSGEFNTDYQI